MTARTILNELKDGNVFLAKRLETLIIEYEKYIQLTPENSKDQNPIVYVKGHKWFSKRG